MRTAILMIMESVCLLAFLLLLDAGLPHPSPVLWALLLYPASYALARWLLKRDDRIWVELAASVSSLTATIAVAGLLVALTSDRGAGSETHQGGRFVFAALLGAIGWARGWWIARVGLDPRTFVASFQFGLVMIALALLGLSSHARSMAVQSSLVFGYAIAGLIGPSVSRAAEGPSAGGKARLAGTLAALAGLIVVFSLAGLLWLVLDRAAMESAGDMAAAAGRTVLVYLKMLASLFPEGEMTGTPAPTPPAPLELTVPDEPPPQAAEVGLGLRILIGVTLAAIAILLISQLVRLAGWLRGSRRTASVTYHDSGDGFLSLLWALLRSSASSALGVCRGIWRKLLQSLSRRQTEGMMRERYTQLLRRLALRGWRRRPDETANEYQLRLSESWPGSEPDLSTFTRMFVADRYSGHAADPLEVEAVWKRLGSIVGKVSRRDE